jgi:hypothetical protein
MTKLVVMNNGWAADLSGIEIYAHDNPVSLTYSLIFGNAKHGLLIHDEHVPTILTGTVFFGNDLDNSGDADFYGE